MRKIVLTLAAVMLGATLVALDAEAARMGGGRSIGAQRSVTPSRPAQQMQQAAPAKQTSPQQGAAAQPQAAQPASGWAKWGPMLGGLALGGVLGWLMGANGLGGLLVGMMLVALLVFVVAAVLRSIAQRRAGTGQPVQYAGLGSETVAAPPPSQASGFERAPAQAASTIPDGFDVAGFLKAAKLNYMKLQIANDKGDLEELREFTSPELFEELKRDILGRAGAAQHTDVLSLNADLLEVATEGSRHWASVRFSGTIRESAAGSTEGFEEVWNLAKPVDGSSGWTLAGIQQMH
ncbi:MAG TPA: Tim44-like domain-containing protein [Burkholderiales bacterium]|jgi:predicted lipid-binding transport protein (Tim44 family)|nr:Tim44-like domain-containing protein [Burkholderiales bacterium]